jgi:hypothetical protein
VKDKKEPTFSIGFESFHSRQQFLIPEGLASSHQTNLPPLITMLYPVMQSPSL